VICSSITERFVMCLAPISRGRACAHVTADVHRTVKFTE